MFCSSCGTSASGNFCSRCGTRLTAIAAPEEPQMVLLHWTEEVHYNTLVQNPEVRDLVARHAAQATRGMSSEQFLKACDALFSPLGGVPLAPVVSLLLPIYSRMGIRTGKTREGVIPHPPGRVIVAALCSLARNGRPLKQAHQGEDGCALEAVLPSDMWASEGELLISFRREGRNTRVEAATKIPGQLFDWGKSNRCLNQLFEDLHSPQS